jgi:hypothetical protein
MLSVPVTCDFATHCRDCLKNDLCVESMVQPLSLLDYSVNQTVRKRLRKRAEFKLQRSLEREDC